MVNLEEVTGYGSLNQEQKELFKKVYSNNMSCIESEKLKAKFTPIKVSAAAYGVRVEFKAMSWLHYTWKGEWY